MTSTKPDPQQQAPPERAVLFSAVADNLAGCTAAFVDTKPSGSELPVGSGVFIGIDGRLFLATAGHTIPSVPHGRLGFVTDRLENVKNSVYPILGHAVAKEPLDVGYLEYAPEVATLLGKAPIKLDRISPRGSGETNRLIYVVGFPSDLIKQEVSNLATDIRLIDCDFKVMFYTNAPTPEDSWPEPESPAAPANRANDIFLGYDQEGEIWRLPGREGPAALVHPKGTSGGGWWQGVDYEGELWHPEIVQLIGIQSEWSKKQKFIRGCQIHHWLRLVYDNEPALRDSLRTQFPELFDDDLAPSQQ